MDKARFAGGRSGRMAVVAGAMALGCIGAGGFSPASAVGVNPDDVAIASRAFGAGASQWAASAAADSARQPNFRKIELGPRQVQRIVGGRQEACKWTKRRARGLVDLQVQYCSSQTPTDYLLGATEIETAHNDRDLRRAMTTVSDGTLLFSTYNRRRHSGHVAVTGNVDVTFKNADGATSIVTLTVVGVARYERRTAVISYVFFDPETVGTTVSGAVERANRTTVILARRNGLSV